MSAHPAVPNIAPDGQRSYHRPPADYTAPKAACCEGVPYCHPVIGGIAWSHIGSTSDGHALVLDHDWLDVSTGEWYPADQVLVLYDARTVMPGQTTDPAVGVQRQGPTRGES